MLVNCVSATGGDFIVMRRHRREYNAREPWKAVTNIRTTLVTCAKVGLLGNRIPVTAASIVTIIWLSAPQIREDAESAADKLAAKLRIPVHATAAGSTDLRVFSAAGLDPFRPDTGLQPR